MAPEAGSSLSRNVDPSNFQLKPEVFRKVCFKLGYHPTLDLFATRHNKQCHQYCAWRVDPQSKGNAFQVNWNKQTNWMNPPWDLIPKALAKLKEDKATVLACLPVWPAKHWWRQVLHMQVGPSIQIRHQPIFRNQSGRDLYPPRWATLFTLLKGRA